MTDHIANVFIKGKKVASIKMFSVEKGKFNYIHHCARDEEAEKSLRHFVKLLMASGSKSKREKSFIINLAIRQMPFGN